MKKLTTAPCCIGNNIPYRIFYCFCCQITNIPFTWLLDTSKEAYYNSFMVLAQILQNMEHIGWFKLIWNYCPLPILYFAPS